MSELTSQKTEKLVEIINRYDHKPGRLLDIIQDIQGRELFISQEMIDLIARELGIHRVAVNDMVSFYYYFHRQPGGITTLYLSYCPGHDQSTTIKVESAFCNYLRIKPGETTADGVLCLDKTSCIGMCDQRPALLIKNRETNLVLTRITPQDVPLICEAIRRKENLSPFTSFTEKGTGNTAFPNAIVENVIHQSGPCHFAPFEPGRSLRIALNLKPEEVINVINLSGLRGRGGAGFPTGMKWDFCRRSSGTAHYIVCNADEGEPGTFKDRVLLTEATDLVIEGLTIGGYAIGSGQGYIYLRSEYQYLQPYLEQVLARRRKLGLLGKNICGKSGFNFDIRLELGAGAYICGEESALLESLEGKRGAPRDRPPYPVHKGYEQQPTTVNNVETLACTARIMDKGAAWFSQTGTRDSKGYKIFSVSGDCLYPGIYELPFGLTIDELLEKAGALNAQAVQLGGAAGYCFAPQDYGRRICYEDAPCNGSVIVIGKNQDLLDVVLSFSDFFKDESCGWCVPCRVGTTMLIKKLKKIKAERGTETDLIQLKRWCDMLHSMSRCGLGIASANPVLSTLRNFPEIYAKKLASAENYPGFKLNEALLESFNITGRKPHPGQDEEKT